MIVIDPGHGGNDPGAIGNGIVEKDYNLMISKYMYDRFKELGVPVFLTRDTDETLSPEERVNRVLNAFGNNPDVIVLSNHLNASGGDGAEVIYALRNNDTLARLVSEEIEKEGQNVRQWYQRRLPSDTSKDYYFILRDTGNTEAILIEYGFVDSPGDDPQIIKTRWQDLAEAVVRAVSIYKGIPYEGMLEEGIYTVQAGDTLYSIARRFNVSVEAITSANNLTSNLLSINQKLIIPGLMPPSLIEVTYVVQPGDSLYSIARAYDTTVDKIMETNNLTSTLLQIGQILKIPTPMPSIEPSLPTPPSSDVYIVRAGDNLYSIAQRFKTTVQVLRDLNNLTTDLLSIGQILKLPITAIEEPAILSLLTYTVQKGDSLYSIARRYNTTVNAIMDLNNLTSSALSIGQDLQIPSEGKEPSSITYTVQKGDNLYAIANRYHTTVTAIMDLNKLKSSALSIGQTLLIPANSNRQEVVTIREQPLPLGKDQGLIRYTIQKGDTLYTLANRYHTTVEQLKRINNLTTAFLRVGQQLLIPKGVIEGEIENQPNITNYVVKKGDTLWGLAHQFGTSVSALRVLNNIEGDLIIEGQTLLIPIISPLQIPSGTTIYIVKKDDNLYKIAKMYDTTVEVLKELNNLDNDLINLNQVLLIPLIQTNDKREVALDQSLPVIIRYTVKKGDTLAIIANNFGTNVETLRRINNLTTDILRIGQELLVPRTPLDVDLPIEGPTAAIYTVESGNTLWSIAHQFGTTVSELKELNNLTNNLIKINQELIVPIVSPLIVPPGTTAYIVKKNDTLYKVAKAYKTNVETLKILNDLTDDLINVGQILLIPLA